MKMKKTIAFILLAIGMIFSTVSVQAQTFGGPESMKGLKVVGCNMGLGGSGYQFYAGVAPQLGFRLTRSLEAGVRLGYDLNLYRDYQYGNYFCHYFSGAVYANLEIYRGIYVLVEDEEMCMMVRGKAINPTAPRWYNSVFAGAGYRQYFSETGFVYYAFLYNLSWDYNYNGSDTTPYASPFVVRAGYCIGF